MQCNKTQIAFAQKILLIICVTNFLHSRIDIFVFTQFQAKYINIISLYKSTKYLYNCITIIKIMYPFNKILD